MCANFDFVSSHRRSPEVGVAKRATKGSPSAIACPPPPGNLHRYQNNGVAGGAVWNWLKIKEIVGGKKGKAESRRQDAEGRKDRKARGGRVQRRLAGTESRVHDL